MWWYLTAGSFSSFAEEFERFRVNGRTFAIMSKIVGLMFLLIILVNNLCGYTAAPAQLLVTKADIRKCRCTYVSSGVSKCPKQLVPTDKKGKLALDKCLCTAGKKQDRPELRQFCHTPGSATPI